MRDVLTDLASWWRAGATVGVGTVVDTWRSAPRPAGAAMLVGPDATVVGSVSGGCVEGAVFELAQAVRGTGRPVLQRYGVSDDDAFAVGLTCGGMLDVYVEAIDRQTFPDFGEVAEDVAAGRPVAVATVIQGDALGRRLVVRPGSVRGSLGGARLDAAVGDDVLGLLEQGTSQVLRYGRDGERRHDEIAVFVASYAPKPRMIVFGAIDFAAAVARVGSFLGYRVTVCDARATFATRRRFPDADEVVVAWPHVYLADTEVDERTVVCVLTHDPKFDVPLLQVALRMPLAYLGAMGSRRTNDERAARLRELGFTGDDLARLHAPIGLDVGGRTPEETAISVAAEIISSRWGGSGAQLRDVDGPIHVTATAPADEASTVAQAMITDVKINSSETTVGELRALFADPKVHSAVIVEDGRLLAVVDRTDLSGAASAADEALPLGRYHGRVVAPDDDLAAAQQRLVAAGRRRFAVIDGDGTFRGLLCLKRSLTGFCSDRDLEDRRRDPR